MNQDNRNLVLAIVCSALLVIGYQIFFELPKQQALEEQALQDQKDLILTAPENNIKSQKEVETSIIENEVVNAPRIPVPNSNRLSWLINASAAIAPNINPSRSDPIKFTVIVP